MILTDKCKEDFDKWYVPYIRKHPFVGDKYFDDTLIDQFYEWTDSMQFGIYVDFLDSVGIHIEMFRNRFAHHSFYFELEVGIPLTEYLENEEERKVVNTRPEARIKAIEKANKIYNND